MSTELRWLVLVGVILVVLVGALHLSARAVGGWRELRDRQFSYGVPTRYIAFVLPLSVVATVIIDPTRDRKGTGWISGVVLLLAFLVSTAWRHRERR